MNVDKAIRILQATVTEEQAMPLMTLLWEFERARNHNEFALAFLTDQKPKNCTQEYLEALRGLLQ